MNSLRGLLLALWVANGAVASASGPLSYAARFWASDDPGVSLDQFAVGNLGILDIGQDPALQILAYRQLSGLDLDATSRAVWLESLRPQPPVRWDEQPEHQWLGARRRVPGAEPLKTTWISTDRLVERRQGTATWSDYVPNCLGDAFLTAARTLDQRIAEHGAESAEVHEWLFGQDQVFALCQQGEETPRLLDAPWPAWLRRDREYQIAAAHFYAFHHQEALRRFAEISRDAESPWRDVARYLMARTALRAGDNEHAGKQIASLLGDPKLSAWHPAARRLAGLLALRNEPAARREVLRTRLLAPRLVGVDPAVLRQERIDFLWLGGVGSGNHDLDRWLTAMAPEVLAEGESPGDPSPDPPAYQAWRETKSLSWLVAAVVVSEGDETDLDTVLAAAAKVPATSPAALTLGYHRARLLARHEDKADEARQLLDALLKRSDLPLAVANRLRQLRASLAPTLDEYLAWSFLEPVALGYHDGGRIWEDEPVAVRPKQLTDEAVAHLNLSVSAAELARIAAKADLLSADWRQRLGLAAWVRALLAADSVLGESMVPPLKPLVPAPLATELEAWRGVPAGAERDFAAWLILLRYPGLSPWVQEDVGRRRSLDEMDGLRSNGWCEDSGELAGMGFEPAKFPRSIPDDAARPKLEATPIYLGSRVLAFAESHRDDPRVPEALHRLVRYTRLGCAWGDEVGVVSKRAFDLLHRRYPKSPWTEKTPYWFQG